MSSLTTCGFRIRAGKESVLAFVIQYSFITAFFWLNAMCLDISWTFRGLRANTVRHLTERNRRNFLRFSIYCWGFPGVISSITAFMQFLPSAKSSFFFPGFGITRCFFQDNSPSIWLFFYGPTSLLLFINLLLFIFTAFRIVSIRRDRQNDLQNQQSSKHRPKTKDQQTFSLYTKLFFMMGVSWATEMLSSIFGGPRYYYYFTDILNLLRAVFIFVFFCCKRKVFILLTDRYGEKIPILKRFFPNEREMSKSTNMTEENTVGKNDVDTELI